MLKKTGFVDCWLIKERYSNMEQIINDWQRDGGSKPISLGDLNKHCRPKMLELDSLYGTVQKRRINRPCRGVKTCSSLTVSTKSSLSPAEGARVTAGVYEAVRRVNNSRIGFNFFSFFLNSFTEDTQLMNQRQQNSESSAQLQIARSFKDTEVKEINAKHTAEDSQNW